MLKTSFCLKFSLGSVLVTCTSSQCHFYTGKTFGRSERPRILTVKPISTFTLMDVSTIEHLKFLFSICRIRKGRRY